MTEVAVYCSLRLCAVCTRRTANAVAAALVTADRKVVKKAPAVFELPQLTLDVVDENEVCDQCGELMDLTRRDS